MLIKRLEMTGFKSFATRTVVEFMPGVTVIVGPNGCGKSNVSDAIRWVLGEQSARSLRGGRMGDVIFSGSATLKPLGYAQVTLTLDNSDRRLPLDQTEIQITRRLFRDGESEYQLNRVNCRLKDIVTLFLDTGVGSDGYSLMEQGRVDQIINARPSERREIFEEAAGISKYKVRREEAIRKLSRTDDDLVRLRDILVDVERSCASLKRQAQKAARWRRLKERERDLDQRLVVRRADTLEADLARQEARTSALEDRLQQIVAAVATLEARQVESQERQSRLHRALHEAQALNLAVRGELERARADHQEAGERLEKARRRLAEIEQILDSVKKRATALVGAMQALSAEAAEREVTLRERRENLAELSRRFEETRRQSDSTALRAGELRGEISALEQRRLQAENERQMAARLLESLRGDMETLSQEIERLTQAAREQAEEAGRRRQQRDAATETLRALGEQRRALEAEISRHAAERNELQQRLDSLTERHHQTRSRLVALRELEQAFEGYFLGVKETLKAAQAGKLRGILGAVSSLLRVRKEHETAIEAALGAKVQDIVTERVEDARDAIEFLKRNGRGRATFLPLDFLEVDPPDERLRHLTGRPGVIGFARELVEYEPRLEKAVRHLFGSTLVVEQVDVAIALMREGRRARYVSLEGELIHPRGELTGGTIQTRGLLSRAREIRQLDTESRQIEVQLEELRNNLRETKDRLNESHARSAELQQKIHEADLEAGAARKDLEAAELALRERRAQLAQAEARLAQRRAESARHEEAIERCRNSATQMASQAEEAASRLQALESTLQKGREEVEALGAAVGEQRIEVAALTERQTATREKILSIEAELAQAREDQETRAEEERDLREDVELQQRRIADAEGRMAELSRRAERQDQAVSLKSQEIQTLEVEMRRLDQELQGARRDRNELENQTREAQVRLAEVRAQLAYLENETLERFGVSLAQTREELRARLEAAGESPAPEIPELGEEEETPEGADAAAAGEAAASAEPAATRETAGEPDLNDPAVLRRLLAETREKITRLGSVNATAIEEYEEKSKRLEFLTAQSRDLTEAKKQLEDTIRGLDKTCVELFNETFEKIRQHFMEMFRRLFNGGRADLTLLEPEPGSDQLEAGIEILAQPPGKKLQSISLMSGGEKALTAVSLMFALFLHKPSPFCLLDEIDAPLDDANVGRFCDMLREFSGGTQFLIITHNKLSMSLADTIYGVTMQEPGISKLVSVKFEDAAVDRLLSNQIAG